jgi:hypothetical protein
MATTSRGITAAMGRRIIQAMGTQILARTGIRTSEVMGAPILDGFFRRQ